MAEGWEDLLEQARLAWEDGRVHDALQLCDRAALMSQPARYGAAILRGDILLDMGDAPGALSSYESVADPSVPDAELDCARGIALFEMARFAEAENALQSAVRGDSKLAEGHFVLGLLAEIVGNGQETEYFRRARRLDPERFPPTPKLSQSDFEAVVEEALERLPERVRLAMRTMPVLVAELPRPEDLKEADPPLSPRAFGMFVALAEGPPGVFDDSGPAQPAVLLFKRNLERNCSGRDQLVQAIRDTVLEETVAALNLPYDDDLEDWPQLH